jgi:drug/metabolite transporter (DMT)-like permease
MPTLTRQQIIGLVLLTFMWGLNWPVMKLSLRELDPLHFRMVTMAAGALVLGLYFRAQGVRMLPANGREWLEVAILAAPNILGWHVLSVIALNELPAGRAVILGFTMPVWTVLLGVLFYRERMTTRLLLALAAVVAGIALLLSNELAHLSGHLSGVLWMQGAAFSWALGTIWMRRSKLTLPPQSLVVWMMALSAIPIAILAWRLEPAQNWAFSTGVWFSLVWAVLINYGASQVIWFGMARELPPATSAMSLMAVPLIGALSAPVIVGEWPSWQDWGAMLCVLSAMAAVLLRR